MLLLHAGARVSAQQGTTRVVVVGWQDSNGYVHPLPGPSGPGTAPMPFPTRDAP